MALLVYFRSEGMLYVSNLAFKVNFYSHSIQHWSTYEPYLHLCLHPRTYEVYIYYYYYYYYLLTAIGLMPGGSVYNRDIQST
jgi:hypothetical protein